MKRPEVDSVTGTETTGHEWDGIRELNTPLPRWWLWTFVACCIWAVGYWVVMPAWPLVSSYTRGALGYSQRAVVASELAAARANRATLTERLTTMPVEAIESDPDLFSFAIAAGRSAYLVNCAQCHGTGASGAKGYPNLNDDDWLWGGTPEAIEQTIRFGIRSGHPQARDSAMPAFVADGQLTDIQARLMANHVLDLAQGNAGQSANAALYAETCAACHGDRGQGDPNVGAPRLTDSIWLYGNTREAIIAGITAGRRGVMPGWQGRLDDATIKQLAVYVHSLGGGK